MAETAFGVDLNQFHWSVTVAYAGVYLMAIFSLVPFISKPVEYELVGFFAVLMVICAAYVVVMAPRTAQKVEDATDD